MITQFTISFIFSSDLIFQSFSGYAVRGLFFELIKKFDQKRASDLHSLKRVAPYALTPIEFVDRRNKWRFAYKRARGPSIGKFTLTVLDDYIASIIKEAVVSGELERVQFGNVVCNVTEIDVRIIDYKMLLEKSKPVKKFTVRFRTPCYFRRKPRLFSLLARLKDFLPVEEEGVISKLYKERFERYVSIAYPLPDPYSMIANLARLWDNFSKVPIESQSLLDWVDVGGFVLAGIPQGVKTMRFFEHPTTKKWQMGFVGSVRFSIPEELYDERKARLIDLLMKFGEIVNVGANRTAGFGVIDYIRSQD